MFLIPMQTIFAYDFEVDGLYYNLVNNTYEEMYVSVTTGDHKYSGNIIIPDSIMYKGKTLKVKDIDERAFNNCIDLTSIRFNHLIKYINSGTFLGCTKLKNLIIPPTISIIYNYAFYGCTNLKNLTFEDSDSPLRFGTNGAYGPSSVFDCKPEYLYMGRVLGKPELGKGYDLDNTELKSLIIGNKIKTLSGFCGAQIRKLSIPPSVTYIGKGAFKDCDKLEYVLFEDGTDIIKCDRAYIKEYHNDGGGYLIDEATFVDCPIKEVYIGRPMTRRDASNTLTYPFVGTSVEKVVISQRLSSLCEFTNCKSLKEIDIPASVTEITSFVGCSSLTKIKCRAVNPPLMDPWQTSNVFDTDFYLHGTLYVPIESIDLYKNTKIWGEFWEIKGFTDDGSEIETKKCAKPTINYLNGKLIFDCATEGSTCQSTIADSDISSYSVNEVQLGVTYNIRVYATKPGYENSEVATATLCWIDQLPDMKGIAEDEDIVTEVKATPVLIQSEDGTIYVKGGEDGTKVSVYEVNGRQVGSMVSYNGKANIRTNMQSGSTAIVKIADRSLKVLIK